jgi:hypothetical protein
MGESVLLSLYGNPLQRVGSKRPILIDLHNFVTSFEHGFSPRKRPAEAGRWGKCDTCVVFEEPIFISQKIQKGWPARIETRPGRVEGR